MVQIKKSDFIKLKSPEDVLLYVQRLVNRIRREGLELDPAYIGKIIYLLNTWLSAYKANLEVTELQQLQEEIKELRQLVEARK